ncbi:hypothetical protein F4680DRAFT_285892 [Xylaria scruposa]|nr:hypothetical protein F4680DRAFT_285892 [Xylaria scruposa]
MMYNSKALLSAALLTGASVAQSSSESNDAQCTQSYISLIAGAPTPDGQLASAITSYASGVVQSATATDANPLAIVTQVCDFSSNLPSSLQSDFDAYVTQVISYVSASSSAIDAVITNCVATGAEGAAYTSLVNSFAAQTGPLCAPTGTTTSTVIGTGTSTPSGASNGTTTFVTGTPSPSSTGANGGGASSSVPTGAAAMPTAVLGGAAAAAGLLGAIALL